MGAAPASALAVAVVPFGPEARVEEELFQMMAGASETLAAAGCALVGGHSCEGAARALYSLLPFALPLATPAVAASRRLSPPPAAAIG